MKKILLITAMYIFMQASNELNFKANKEFEKGNTEIAKNLYEKSAEQGDAEVNYQLTYGFVLNDDERIKRLKSAASKGHKEALYSFLTEQKEKNGSIRNYCND